MGIPQAGSKISRPQAHAEMIAIGKYFLLEELAKVFIRLVLDELSLVGNPLRLPDPSPRGNGIHG